MQMCQVCAGRSLTSAYLFDTLVTGMPTTAEAGHKQATVGKNLPPTAKTHLLSLYLATTH